MFMLFHLFLANWIFVFLTSKPKGFLALHSFYPTCNKKKFFFSLRKIIPERYLLILHFLKRMNKNIEMELFIFWGDVFMEGGNDFYCKNILLFVECLKRRNIFFLHAFWVYSKYSLIFYIFTEYFTFLFPSGNF